VLATQAVMSALSIVAKWLQFGCRAPVGLRVGTYRVDNSLVDVAGDLTDMNRDAIAVDARHDCLIDIDIGWLLCCDAVELPRRSYEEAVVSAQGEYRSQQASASAVRSQALVQAWTTYKQQVANAPVSRRDVVDSQPNSRGAVIAQALATYKRSEAEIRQAYEASMTSARDHYVRALQDALSASEAAVAQAFATYRETIRSARLHFEPAQGGGADTTAQREVTRSEEVRVLHSRPVSTTLEASGFADKAHRIAESFLSSLNASDSQSQELLLA
jgi:hypothetical protein